MIVLLAVITFHAFLLARLIFFPYQEIFTYPYFTSRGLLPYAQVMDQHFPGFMFFPVNLATFGVVNEYAARAFAVGIVVLVHLLIYFLGRKFVGGKWAVLGNILFLVWQPVFEGWVLWIDSFLPLILLPAFWFSYRAYRKGKLMDFVLSGLLLGIGVVFKQVVVPIVAVVGMLLVYKHKDLKKALVFILGLAVPVGFMVLYVWRLGVFEDFWYWTVTYNLEIFSKLGRKYPTPYELLRVLGVFGFGVFSVFYKNKKQVLWLWVFMLGALLAAYARFDFVHFQPALPFLCLLSLLGFKGLWGKRLMLPVVGLYVISAVVIINVFYRGHLGSRVLFFDDTHKSVAAKIREYAGEEESIFIFGASPHLYQMSSTLPSGHVYIQQYPWFMFLAEDRTIEGLSWDLPKVVVADFTVEVAGQNISDYSPKVARYLKDNFEVVEQIESNYFMIKKDKL